MHSISLALLEVAPDHISVPLLAAVGRAPLGPCEAVLFFFGGTGNLKSELAARGQQHFGSSLDREHLPQSWQSTENAIKETGFLCKDSLLVVDDFKPAGVAREQHQMHRVAEGVIRAWGNQSGRQRMTRNGHLRPDHPPRGLLVATGEDLPWVESIRARIVAVNVDRGAVNLERMTAAQAAGARGDFARTTSAYLRWLAAQSSDLSAARDKVRAELGAIGAPSAHLRTWQAILELLVGWRTPLGLLPGVQGAVRGLDERALCPWSLGPPGHRGTPRRAPARGEPSASLRFACLRRTPGPSGPSPRSDRQMGRRPKVGLEASGLFRRMDRMWRTDRLARRRRQRLSGPDSCFGRSRTTSDRVRARVSALDHVVLGQALREAGLLVRAEPGRGNVGRLTVDGAPRGVLGDCANCVWHRACARNRPNRPNRPDGPAGR